MKITEITKQDTTIFKAIGILLVVFHNYFRWVKPTTGENEFNFSIDVINNLFNGIADTPSETINLLFSCLGHYGVQIFIFISGVGLTISMIDKKKNYMTYILHRLKILYSMLIVGIIFYFFAKIITEQHILNVKEWLELLWKFLLIHTFLPNQCRSVIGPWWFFGLIFQLYLLFPLLFNIIKKFNLKGFIAVCLFSFACTYTEAYIFNTPNGIDWMTNSIAHLQEFAFGILIAMNFQKRIHPLVFVFALIVFALGNFFKMFFPLSFLSITIILYFIVSKLIVFINKSELITKILMNIGTLSMAIFIIHGFFRKRFIPVFSNNWYEKIIGALLFFIAVYAISIAANIFYKWIYDLFDKISRGKDGAGA
jgi:hypothetical protein